MCPHTSTFFSKEIKNLNKSIFKRYRLNRQIKIKKCNPQEVDQSVGTMLYEVEVTSSNFPPLLCEHIKKNKINKK
jgi:hypothetical protein